MASGVEPVDAASETRVGAESRTRLHVDGSLAGSVPKSAARSKATAGH